MPHGKCHQHILNTNIKITKVAEIEEIAMITKRYRPYRAYGCAKITYRYNRDYRNCNGYEDYTAHQKLH